MIAQTSSDLGMRTSLVHNFAHSPQIFLCLLDIAPGVFRPQEIILLTTNNSWATVHRHIQLLQSRCLLIVSDKHENLKVYLDDVDILDKEIEANHTKASFSYMGIGPDVKITVDETLSLLAFVSSDRNVSVLIHDSIESLSANITPG